MQDWELTEDDTFSFVRGYLKIGEYDKALHCLSGINRDGSMLKSLKYASIKTMILEKQGKHEQALGMYKEYTATLERYHGELLSQGLLFADKKHQLEVENLREIQGRDRIIWSTLCGILGLLLFAGWLYYRGYKKELVAANLRFEISRLESERDSLKELQGSQSEWSKPLQKIIESRFEMLNGLLAREITSDESHAKSYYKWIESVRSDKQKFMDSTRLAFTASHPKFIDYLEQHGLSADEINYLCLYAIGLCGKEVGEYIQLKRHYSISSEIRKKLGMGEHETNIGIYVRRLLKESGGIR